MLLSVMAQVPLGRPAHHLSGRSSSVFTRVAGLGLASSPVSGFPAPIRKNRLCFRALHDGASEGFDEKPRPPTAPSFKAADISGLEVENGAWIQGQTIAVIDENDSIWEQVGSNLRVAYALGVYGGMALAGQAICHFIGIDKIGGFDLSANVVMQGIGYAIPPMMGLLFILDDEVVKKSLPARAIRDVEDEELMSFFVGLSPSQILFVVSVAAIAEELFFRVAIQGGLAHMFMSDEKIKEPIDGISALTGVFPILAPFAQGLAAFLTAALTGSILFITSYPQDPKYIIAPGLRNRTSLQDLKKSFTAWYERRQLRRIYSPLLESLLAVYLGFEWIQTGNILAPTITHIIYSSVVVGNGVRRIHDQRAKLRQRTKSLSQKNITLTTLDDTL